MCWCEKNSFLTRVYPGIAEFFNLDGDEESKLIELNDGKSCGGKVTKGKSFRQIARWIEKNLIPKAKTK